MPEAGNTQWTGKPMTFSALWVLTFAIGGAARAGDAASDILVAVS